MRPPAALLLVLMLGLLVPAVHAEPRYAVTLRSGFVMEAEEALLREGKLILRVNGGDILLSNDEIASIEELPARNPTVNRDAGLPETTKRSQAEQSVPELIRAAAIRHGLPETFVRSVAEAESALQPNAASSKGARGVMQLMPATAEALGVDSLDPAENVEGGAKLLRALLIRYQHHPDQVRRALAAYNAGAGAVQKYNGVPPYRETQVYIERVLRRYRLQPQSGSLKAEPLPEDGTVGSNAPPRVR